jgi:hypothetical protein
MKEESGIYVPSGSDGYELCHPVSPDDFERINVEVNGTPRRLEWKPIAVRFVHEDRGRRLLAADSPWLGSHALIFKRGAVEGLGAELLHSGELLPLTCVEADVWTYNPIRVIDALDEVASSVLRFGDGRPMLIQKYVFRADIVGSNDIFKIPNLRVSPTFVSQKFVDRWRTSGLKGLDFTQVWPPSN